MNNVSLPSVMAHNFAQVPSAEIQRSSFKRSHGHKTTFDFGQLIPFYFDEVLPADTFNLKCQAFARLATPIHPIMDNMYLDTHFFFIPYRLVWENFQKFMGERENPNDSTDYLVPRIGDSGFTVGAGSLFDYFGLPVGVNLGGSDNNPNSPLFRAYNLVWNEWFRDENLQDSVLVETGDGPDSAALYDILPRGKRHDYFSSCLPFPQKGDSVSLPLGETANVFIPSTATIGDTLYIQNGDGAALPRT